VAEIAAALATGALGIQSDLDGHVGWRCRKDAERGVAEDQDIVALWNGVSVVEGRGLLRGKVWVAGQVFKTAGAQLVHLIERDEHDIERIPAQNVDVDIEIAAVQRIDRDGAPRFGAKSLRLILEHDRSVHRRGHNDVGLRSARTPAGDDKNGEQNDEQAGDIKRRAKPRVDFGVT